MNKNKLQNFIYLISNKKFYDLNNKEKIRLKVILNELYWKFNLSFRNIAALFKRDYDTILQWFKKFNLPKRTHKESIITRYIPKSDYFNLLEYKKQPKNKINRDDLLNKISKELIENVNLIYTTFSNKKAQNKYLSSESIPKQLLSILYNDCKLSLMELGIIFGLSASKIRKRMQKYDISRRSLSESLTKFPKKEFKINSKEDLEFKSYLIGAKCGDLYAILEERRIICNVSSTHPSMEKLIKNLFENFGNIKSYPFENRKDKYAWNIIAYLHESFSFLVPYFNSVPDWINNDEELFISFLAGLIDTDGCVSLKNKNPKIQIDLANKDLLNSVKKSLKLFNYFAILSSKKNHESHFGKKKMWTLQVSRKDEAKKLISILPLRHEEKVQKVRLIFDKDKKDINYEWKKLTNQIKNDCFSYQNLAKELVTKVI